MKHWLTLKTGTIKTTKPKKKKQQQQKPTNININEKKKFLHRVRKKNNKQTSRSQMSTRRFGWVSSQRCLTNSNSVCVYLQL